jgi:hypothetical protein
MSNSYIANKIRRNLSLRAYLEEISSLVGHRVQANDLVSVVDTISIQENIQKFILKPKLSWVIPFSDRGLERFGIFIKTLQKANPSPVFIWTPRTADCGTFLVQSLDMIRFDFDFLINPEGILVFVTDDFADRLLLDFSRSQVGEQMMEIEIQGDNWMNATY